MKTTNILLWPAAALLGFSSLSAHAVPTINPPQAPASLFEFNVNLDNYVSYVYLGGSFFDPLPVEVNDSLFDYTKGLGTITATISGAGAHNFDAYFDHDISYDALNELGSVTGTPGTGQSWEIDEPWSGDIYDNLHTSTLDNSIGMNVPEDVAMAMGWDFSLAANEIAEISLQLTENVMPTSGFFLQQSNIVSAGSNYELYLTGSLSISCVQSCGGPEQEPGKVPEPSMLMLMGIGLAGMVASRRRKRV